MSIQRIAKADMRKIHWRNGRGTTVEVLRATDGDDALLWRVSIADVVEDGPFSLFPGIDRTLTLIEGAGFDLDFGAHGAVRPLIPFEPVHFSGDWRTSAENVRGPSRDLNIMTARGRCRADIVLHRSAFSGTIEPKTLFLGITGQWTMSIMEQTWAIDASEALHADGSPHATAVAAEGNGVLALITLHILE